MADLGITQLDHARDAPERMSDLDIADALNTIKLKAGGVWLATVGARESGATSQSLSWIAHELEEYVGEVCEAFEKERALRMGERQA